MILSEQLGIMEFEKISNDKDSGMKVVYVEEKSTALKSNYALVDLYFYPAGVSKMAEKVRISERGELEITTLNDMSIL